MSRSALELPEKHFSVQQRRRRFDPTSKYGGHQGATLVKFDAGLARDHCGFDKVLWSCCRPSSPTGGQFVSALDLELPQLLATRPYAPAFDRQKGEVLDESNLYRMTEQLASSAAAGPKVKIRSCPGLTKRTYQLPCVGKLEDKSKVVEEPDAPEMQIVVQQMEGPLSERNFRQVPLNFAGCRRGCKRCSKTRGICKQVDETHRMRRRMRRSESAVDFKSSDTEVYTSAFAPLPARFRRHQAELLQEQLVELSEFPPFWMHEALGLDPKAAPADDSASDTSFLFVEEISDIQDEFSDIQDNMSTVACSEDSWTCV